MSLFISISRRCILVPAFFAAAFVQRASAQVAAGINLGLDTPYDFSPTTLTDPPQGYKPFYISHYGRHGSRYAYSDIFYDEPHLLLENAARTGNLTDFGKEFRERFNAVYPVLSENMGLLSDMGRNQQKRIGRQMYERFPEVFPQGAEVWAVSSESMRSVMSMSSLCVGLAGCDSTLSIRIEQSPAQLCCTNPRSKDNSRNVKRLNPSTPEAVDEDAGKFFSRYVDTDAVLRHIFKSPRKAIAALLSDPDYHPDRFGNSPGTVVWHLWVFAAGMINIDEDCNFDDLFTPAQWETMYRADCYLRWREYFKYQAACCQVLDDILQDCRGHISSREKGAKLRFGHDHVMMPLLSILGVDEYAVIPSRPEDCYKTYPTFPVSMACNMQFVLYGREDGSGDVLVKFLYNGREHRLPIETEMFPYYKWSDFEALFEKSLAVFPVVAE